MKCWNVTFQHEPSSEALRQIKQFLVFSLGMMVAKFLSVATQILMGRKFGPEVYGQITLIMLLSSYFSMPIVNGWSLVFIKIAAKEQHIEKKYQALKSLLLIVLLCGIGVILILAAFKQHLATLFNITPELMQLSLAMTFFYAWWILTKQIAQGFQRWHIYIFIENIWAIIVLLGVILLILQEQLTVATVSCVLFTGYFFSGLIFGKAVCKSIFSKINNYYSYDILSHGWFLLLNGLVGTAAFSIDRILINKNLGIKDVGVYQAHFLSTYGIASAFMTIFFTYIFPVFCKNTNIVNFLKKINMFQYPVTIIMSAIVGGLSLWLYSFPVSIFLFLTLCLFNAVQFNVQLKTWYLVSKGANESKVALYAQMIFLSVNIIVLFILVKHIGIAAGGVSLLIAAMLSLAYLVIREIKL